VRRLAVIVVVISGCGGGGSLQQSPTAPTAPSSQAQLPTRAPSHGSGPRYRPLSLGKLAAQAQPISGMRCSRPPAPAAYGVHLELFAAGRVVLIPSGIGIAPERTRRGAEVHGGRCSYPLRTHAPTGVIEVAAADRLTLGDLFAVWGQPLTRTRMAGFRGRVRAYVNGRSFTDVPSTIRLTRHAQIVLEVGAHVPPHRSFLFPPGL
jgi:hypothetical protein